MPATPYTAIPYARSERPHGVPYVSSGRLGDLVRQSGQDAADAELRRGDIAARMWGNVGNAVTQAAGGYFQQKQEEPIRRMQAERAQLDLDAARRAGDAEQRLTRQDAAFASLFEMFPDGNIPPKEVMTIYGPQRGMQIASGLQAFSELATQKVTDARATAGRLAVGLKALPPALQQQFWPAARQAAIAAGLGDEQSIPEQLTGDFLDFVIGSSTGQMPAQPALMNVPAGGAVFDPVTREPVFTAPRVESPTFEADTPEKVHLTAFARERGKTVDKLTAAELQQARKEFNQSDDRGPDPILQEIRELNAANLRAAQQNGGLSPAQFNQASALADDFTAQSKDFMTRRQSMQTILAANDNAAGDLSLIFSFMKMLDPGSVVREQEYANAQNAAGVPDQIRNIYNRVKDGRRLNPAQRQQFIAQSQGLYDGAKQSHSDIVNVYQQRAQAQGIDPKFVVFDLPDPVARTARPPAGPTNTTPPAGSATPNLNGLREGQKRRISEGPFAGQEWTIVNGQARRLK